VEPDEQQAEETDGGTTVVQESTQRLSVPAGGEATAHQEQTAIVQMGESYGEGAESTDVPPAPDAGQTGEEAEGETPFLEGPLYGRPEEMSGMPEEPAPTAESGTTEEPIDGGAEGEQQASEETGEQPVVEGATEGAASGEVEAPEQPTVDEGAERQASEPGFVEVPAALAGEESSVSQPDPEQDPAAPPVEEPLGIGRPEDEL